MQQENDQLKKQLALLALGLNKGFEHHKIHSAAPPPAGWVILEKDEVALAETAAQDQQVSDM